MILVTGGAGFIGSNLLAVLERTTSEKLVASDWLGVGGKWRNLAKRNLHDIVPPEQLRDYLGNHGDEIHTIFHMGAISTTTVNDGDHVLQHNFHLSRDLWEWCSDTNTRLIYASSAATYGDGAMGFKDDESRDYLSKLKPLNLYGWSKHWFDRWVATQKKEQPKRKPRQCVGLKFFNVYGPNEYHKGSQRSVAHQIFPFALKGEVFQLFKSHQPDYADGGQLRDFIWVGDCVDVMLWFFKNPKINGLFNVGTGKARSFADLASAVYRAAGKEPQITYRPMPDELRAQYQYFTQAEMEKLRQAGYTAPFTSLEDGVKQYVQDFLMKDDAYT